MPAKSNRWHRERIVIGIFVGSVVQKMNFTCSGGSSRVFRQGVEGLPREHVDFVDDVDLESRPAGPHVDVLPQLADLVDAAVAGPVDLQHVHVVARADALADVALVAGDGRRALDAVQGLGQDPGGGGLAHAPGPGEQVGMADAVRGDRVGQCLGDVLLADQLLEGLRAIAPGDDDVLPRLRGLGRRRARREAAATTFGDPNTVSPR